MNLFSSLVESIHANEVISISIVKLILFSGASRNEIVLHNIIFLLFDLSLYQTINGLISMDNVSLLKLKTLKSIKASKQIINKSNKKNKDS